VYTLDARFVPDVAGRYVLDFRVFDGKDYAREEVAVLASESNVEPNADAGGDQLLGQFKLQMHHSGQQQKLQRVSGSLNTCEGGCLTDLQPSSPLFTLRKFVPRGKYCLSRPLQFSFAPRCHGE
jgi:hypothetical protein